MEGLFGGPRAPQKPAPIVHKFRCTLEELYNGTTKKMKVVSLHRCFSHNNLCLTQVVFVSSMKKTKTLVDASGKAVEVERILAIDVKKGWKAGTKITFPKEGDERPGMEPADIVFVLEEKPHSVFKREGNDLIYTHSVTLSQVRIL